MNTADVLSRSTSVCVLADASETSCAMRAMSRRARGSANLHDNKPINTQMAKWMFWSFKLICSSNHFMRYLQADKLAERRSSSIDRTATRLSGVRCCMTTSRRRQMISRGSGGWSTRSIAQYDDDAFYGPIRAVESELSPSTRLSVSDVTNVDR